MKDSLLNLYFSIKIFKHKSSVTNITTVICHINKTYTKGLRVSCRGRTRKEQLGQDMRAGPSAGGRPTAQGA